METKTALELKQKLERLGSPEKAKSSAWFFKTAPGQYGEGDVFLGITMPDQRKLARTCADLPLKEILQLLHSKEHECRMTALIILVDQFKKGDEKKREKIYQLYIKNTAWINNWDLVDVSAENIVGPWLENRPDKIMILTELATSFNLWERRIAMLATFAYIKKGHSGEALKIARILLHDQHDLIQKATGWMLREVGKRCSLSEEKSFLKKHYKTMPRTTLRYAIERFPAIERQRYLAGTI